LVAAVEVNAEPSLTSPTSSPAAANPSIHLEENKLFVQLGDNGDGDRTRWILDTGATNHMTGARSTFSELDKEIRGTVRFGDGSVVGIEGRGTVLFTCRSGEHQELREVYHIPQLKANIISLGQLEEDGFKILMEDGFLRIWDEQRRLLTKVSRGPSRLYMLSLNIVRPVCLAARNTEEAWWWHARLGHLASTDSSCCRRGRWCEGSRGSITSIRPVRAASPASRGASHSRRSASTGCQSAWNSCTCWSCW
jgi:hypothetical protein